MSSILRCVFLLLAFGAAPLAQASPLSIVTFGDSTTAPRALPDGSPLATYSDLLRQELPSLLGRPVSVHNAGVGGNTTVHAVARLQQDVLSHDPDFVIVQFGVNDAFVVNGSSTPQLPMSAYVANMQTIVDGIRSIGAEPILMSPAPLSYLVWFTAWEYAPYHDRIHENALNQQYAAALSMLAKQYSVTYVDAAAAYYAYWGGEASRLEDLHLDYVHPNAAGHRLEADLLEEAFADLLAVPEPASVWTAGVALVALCVMLRVCRRSSR
ncbi:MAG: SGNH/GDSL hydrolase family protein [Pirellulales bacterium]